MTTAKFEDNFWGDGNHGFEVLLQNLKSQTTASRELSEYIKERALVEEGYVKILSKLHKTVNAIPESHFGAFTPMWKLVRDTNDQLATVHSQYCKMLNELSREISEYNIAQKEKLKTSMRGEIEAANDSLIFLRNLDGQVQRTRKQYQQGAEHVVKAQEKLQKALADPAVNPKTKLTLESKAKQAKSWMETMKSDHQAAVRRQCEHVMEFQGKMKEACVKFESLEEEHLAQMCTFMLQLARSQNSTLVNIEQHYTAFNSYLDDLSVEKLLLEFVQAKGTGTEKPVPYKFRLIDTDVPTISLNASTEDVRGSSPTPSSKGTVRVDKSIKSRFKKKAKTKAVPNGPVEEQQQQQQQQSENAPAVDEEGYSIRPDTATSISQFPDESGFSKQDSDSDSDFTDDEPETRIKSIKIRETAEKPAATVDDIKASVMSLRLGATSPGMKKATSTHSLSALSTPPLPNKGSATKANKQADDSKSVSSLLDLDDLIIGPTDPGQLGSGLSSLPPPLLPNMLFSMDPMATLTPMSVQAATSAQSSSFPTPSTTSSILAPTSTSTATTAENTSLNQARSRGTSPGPKPIPKPRDSTLKAKNQNQQKDFFAVFEAEEAKDQTASPLPVVTTTSTLPGPPLPSKKRKSNGVSPSSSSQNLTSTTATGSTGQIGSVTKTTSGYSVLSITPEKSFDSVTPFEANFAGSNVTSQDLGTLSASAEGRNLTETRSAGSSPKLSTKFAKEGSQSDIPVTTAATVQGILPLPLPAPRRFSAGAPSRRRSANPTIGGSTSSESLGGLVSSPLTTAKTVPPSRSTSASPISSTGVASNGVATSPQHTATSTSASPVPIAVAIQETCNAIFKGSDMNKCVIKVNGEVMISFPASHVSQLASHEALAFRLSGVDGVERLLHNQHLLKKEGDGYSYKFDMPSLVANLKQIKEKQNSMYCNIQILKYEVKASNGSQLPLKLVSFWKCEPHMTNFRLDYIYQPSSLGQLNKPSLTNITVVVPVSGGVRKSLSKPEGSWVAEQNRIMWKVGDLQPTEEGRGTLHAKFDVVNGPTVPAAATVQFLCDGATMSGLTFELSNDAYKVSLVKNKCLSGKYTSEIVHHY